MNPMAEQVGPDFYDERSLAEVLGSAEEPLSTADVKAMREGKDVLALPTADGHWVFPTWQVADGAVLPGIPDVLAAFASAPVWSIGLWLTTSDERWGGRTPVEALSAGETAAVVEEAAATAARWA